MGCGASSVYAKDGTIAAGKGEAKVSVDGDLTVAYIWGNGEASEKITLQLRSVPSDPKLLKDAKFKDEVTVAPLQPVSVKKPAGLRQARWVKADAEGPLAMGYPGFEPLKLPQVLFAAHKKDEKKHPENATKAGTKKDKEHPYAKDADKAKVDIEACEKFVSPGQMHDDLSVYKDSLVTVEDTLCQNQSNTFASVKSALGFLKEKDAEATLELTEKPQKIIEEKMNCDVPMKENLQKANDGKNKATSMAYVGLVTGAAKALGLEPADLCPGVDGMVANSLGLKAGVAEQYNKYAKFAEAGVTLPTPEEFAAQSEKRSKELLEADKSGAAAIIEKEAAADYPKLHEEKVRAMMEYAVATCKPMDEGAISKGKRVLARWQTGGRLFGFAEGVVESAVVDAAWFEEGDVKKSGKHVVVKFDDGEIANVPVEGIAEEKTDAAKEEDLTPGTLVRAKFCSDAWLDGVVAGPKNEAGYPVQFDPVFTLDLKPSDIRPAHDVDKIASFPHVLYRQNNDVTFSWIDGREDLKVEVNVWREFDDGNVTTAELKPIKNKLKDVKTGDELKESVHGGYKASLPLLSGRNYRYNFKVTPKDGEAGYFVAFGKACEESGSKGFSYTVTC
eukprot:TRINITY_DN3570_c0_g1_i1.p1 TRINITY_DN3570_c0_g1~~TRINITY_DN3570_c0_g1_i1.p1  ORF type:complete len:616 (+),score=355.08 TRINITY_DN3570_c0_g1_i1:57-1904(+)